jgi:hypothetical protein
LKWSRRVASNRSKCGKVSHKSTQNLPKLMRNAKFLLSQLPCTFIEFTTYSRLLRVLERNCSLQGRGGERARTCARV